MSLKKARALSLKKRLSLAKDPGDMDEARLAKAIAFLKTAGSPLANAISTAKAADLEGVDDLIKAQKAIKNVLNMYDSY